MFWDIVSISLVALFLYPYLRYVESTDPRWIWMGVGLTLADLMTKIFKQFTFPLGGQFLRPSNGTNCDIFCRAGPAGLRPGFPSGHMTVTTFFFVYMWLKYKSTYIAVFGLFMILLMAMARLQKQCHNELQVLGGALWGAIAAVAWFNLENLIPWPLPSNDRKDV